MKIYMKRSPSKKKKAESTDIMVFDKKNSKRNIPENASLQFLENVQSSSRVLSLSFPSTCLG